MKSKGMLTSLHPLMDARYHSGKHWQQNGRKLSDTAIIVHTEETDTARDAVQIFKEKLFTDHRVPNNLISSIDPKSTFYFRKSLIDF